MLLSNRCCQSNSQSPTRNRQQDDRHLRERNGAGRYGSTIGRSKAQRARRSKSFPFDDPMARSQSGGETAADNWSRGAGVLLARSAMGLISRRPGGAGVKPLGKLPGASATPRGLWFKCHPALGGPLPAVHPTGRLAGRGGGRPIGPIESQKPNLLIIEGDFILPSTICRYSLHASAVVSCEALWCAAAGGEKYG